MAKVKAVPLCNRTEFIGNDASSGFSLEISDESPPKYGFDNFASWQDKEQISGNKFDDKEWNFKNHCKNLNDSLNVLSPYTFISECNNHMPYCSSSVNAGSDGCDLEIIQEIDGLKKCFETNILEFESCSYNSMAPVTNVRDKIVVSEVSTSGFVENVLQSDKIYPNIFNGSLCSVDFSLGNAAFHPDISATSTCLNANNLVDVSVSSLKSDLFNSKLPVISEKDVNVCKKDLEFEIKNDSVTPVISNSNGEHSCNVLHDKLAENHLKLDITSQPLHRSLFDLDLNFADILSDIDHDISITGDKSSNIYGNSSLVGASMPNCKNNSFNSKLLMINDNVETKEVENICLNYDTENYPANLLTAQFNKENVCDVSLSRLAENHLKSNKTQILHDSSAISDFNLEDILLDISDYNTSDVSSKSQNSGDNSNLCDLLSESENNKFNFGFIENKAVVEVRILDACSKSDTRCESDPMVPLKNYSNTDECSVSLSRLAENHIKCDKTFKMLNSDISLTDLLSDVSDHKSSVTGCKSLNSGGSSYLFDLLCENSNNTHTCSLCVTDNTDDLSTLLDTCEETGSQLSSILSLGDLSNSDILYTQPNKIEINMSVQHMYNPENNSNVVSCNNFEDILSEGKHEINLCVEKNMLEKLKSNSNIQEYANTQLQDTLLPSSEIEDELVLDIDLNFCVKKHLPTDNLFDESLSSESKDSGFDETDFIYVSPFQEFANDRGICSFEKTSSKCVLSKAKPSLLCIALSSRPKFEKSKKEKLMQVRKEFVKHFPVSCMHFNTQHISQVPDSTSEESDECITNRLIFLGQ